MEQVSLFSEFRRASSNEKRLWVQAQADVLEYLLGPMEAKFLDQEGLDMQQPGQVDSHHDLDEPYPGEVTDAE